MTLQTRGEDHPGYRDVAYAGASGRSVLAHPREQQHADAPFGVLVVGPPLDTIGGMSTVVRQTLSLGYSGRYTVEHRPTCHAPSRSESLFAKLRRHTRQIKVLQKTIRRANARIVHIHTCSGFSFYRSAVDAAVARWCGCKTMLHVHGGAFQEFFDSSGNVGRAMIARSLVRADVVIALSASWRTALLAMAPDASVVVVENAVAAPGSRVADAPDCRDARCHFVILARMDDWKGIDDALAAAVLLSRQSVSFWMTLAGPGGSAGDTDTLPRKIKGLGLANWVEYVGPVVGRTKTDLFRSADVFLQPSHHEGMPISILEAMAHGLPVVATTVGAVPEVIEHGVQGLLVEAKSPNVLCDAMTKVVKSFELRVAMGKAARDLVRRRFGLDRLDRDLTQLYDALLRQRSSAVSDGTAFAPAGPLRDG